MGSRDVQSLAEGGEGRGVREGAEEVLHACSTDNDQVSDGVSGDEFINKKAVNEAAQGRACTHLELFC